MSKNETKASDRELLELAAKAAGLEIRFGWVNHDGDLLYHDSAFVGGRQWNPLTDNGAALWLAVSLSIFIYPADDSDPLVVARAYPIDSYEITEAKEDTSTQDRFTATRRAIVRAAAEIGKRMSNE